MDRNSSIDHKETIEWIEHEQDAEVAALATYVPGSDAEKRLVRRIDRRIVVSEMIFTGSPLTAAAYHLALVHSVLLGQVGGQIDVTDI
jgi:hypothetical protein